MDIHPYEVRITYEVATEMAREHAGAALAARRRIRANLRRTSRRYINGQMRTMLDTGTALAIVREREQLANHRGKLHYWNTKRRERRPA